MGKILERDKLKNRAADGKCSVFQGFEGKFPQFVPELYEHFPSQNLTQNTPLQFKNGARN